MKFPTPPLSKETDLSKLREFFSPGPPRILRRDVLQIPPHIADPTEFLDEVLDEFREKNLSSKFRKMTEIHLEVLDTTLLRYRTALMRLLSGQDISDEIYEMNKLIGTIAPQSAMPGALIAREVLLRWIFNIYNHLVPREDTDG